MQAFFVLVYGRNDLSLMFELDEQIVYNLRSHPGGDAQRGIRSGNLTRGCRPLCVVKLKQKATTQPKTFFRDSDSEETWPKGKETVALALLGSENWN